VRTADVDDEVRCCGETHDFAAERDGEDFGAVEPGCAVEHAVYGRFLLALFLLSSAGLSARAGVFGERTVDYNEQIDTKDSESFADAVICVLELALHDGGVDLDDDDSA
jgi:hypothetical protein